MSSCEAQDYAGQRASARAQNRTLVQLRTFRRARCRLPVARWRTQPESQLAVSSNKLPRLRALTKSRAPGPLSQDDNSMNCCREDAAKRHRATIVAPPSSIRALSPPTVPVPAEPED